MFDLGERKPKADDLVRWYQSDKDVKLIIVGMLRLWEVHDIGTLALEYPDAFDELHELAADLLEQSPPDNDPAFTRG